MNLVDFYQEAEPLKRFLEWPRQHYASDPNWLPDPDETCLLSASTNPNAIWRNFLAMDGNTVCGRVTALVNSRLCNEDGQPFGLLGYFECVDDQAVGKLMLEAAVAWLQAQAPAPQTVLAPINFDTWHPYRLRTRGFDAPTFFMEPYNPPYYPALLAAAGFAPRMNYISKTVTDLGGLQAAWQPFAEACIAQGYHFRSFSPVAVSEEMALIYRLSLPTFRDNLFFAKITEAEFRAMYAGMANAADPNLVFFILDPAGEPVGFSFSLQDHRQRQTVNFKTIGILPQVRREGAGAALAYESYRRFQAQGYTCVNHCLMRAGNRADQFDRGLGEITREYALYSRPLRP